jgi:hypothetical protein
MADSSKLEYGKDSFLGQPFFTTLVTLANPIENWLRRPAYFALKNCRRRQLHRFNGKSEEVLT